MEERQKQDTQKLLLRIAIFLLIFSALWWLFVREKTVRLDPKAVPRAVVARGDLAADEKNTIDIFRAVSSSVVFITSVELRRDFFSLNIYEIPRGTGSGFVWDINGRIVTNFHVIGDASRVEVTLADNSKWKAVVVGTAPDKDLAVLQISAPADKLKPIPVGESRNLMVGQKVFAIGNPFGLDQTMTTGIVSALGREITAVTGRTIEGVIQTDAAINPGNSGGPLLDSASRLIGVNTAIYSPTGASAGIGFAVPVEVVNRVIPQIIKHGRVIRPGIGVSIADDRIAERLGIEGVLIIKVQPGSTAESAGLRGTYRSRGDIILGDIIIGVNGQGISDTDDLLNAFERYTVGDTVELEINRDKQRMSISLRLEALTPE
ncbi:MAG: trypsin-like peptidase domain-containing protein [Nitrospiraceae bacterium]|nr:MAG: trypsin-like peptidase domain-containing protein [Nitrospiraceae bacterium]